MQSVQCKHPPITLAGLIPGVKYRLRVYSREQPSITSEYVTFETSGGESWPETRPELGPNTLSLCLTIHTVHILKASFN